MFQSQAGTVTNKIRLHKHLIIVGFPQTSIETKNTAVGLNHALDERKLNSNEYIEKEPNEANHLIFSTENLSLKFATIVDRWSWHNPNSPTTMQKLPHWHHQNHGIVPKKCNSSAPALELRLFCTNPTNCNLYRNSPLVSVCMHLEGNLCNAHVRCYSYSQLPPHITS